MKIGAMTNPFKKLIPQIQWIGENGFGYVDLAVEPPEADIPVIDISATRKMLDRFGLEPIVHTSPFLAVASPHQRIREAVLEEFLDVIELAAGLESPLMTLHYLGSPPWFTPSQTLDLYARLLETLTETATPKGVKIAIENSPINRGEAALFGELFDRVPEAYLLLDVGHTHLTEKNDTINDFLDDPRNRQRLIHLHVSDNDGQRDLHVPMGSVRRGIHWPETVQTIRKSGYDGRVTLEVFSPDLDYLLTSRDKFIEWWNRAGE